MLIASPGGDVDAVTQGSRSRMPIRFVRRDLHGLGSVFHRPTDSSTASSNARARKSRGQSLAEFALVAPVVIAVIGGIVQFGVLFWAQNTLTQVVRDTGRWEATQQSCSNNAAIVAQANSIAANSALIGYSTPWTETASGPGVSIQFLPAADTGCPPKDNSTVYYVSVTIRHQVPTFFPGLEYLPVVGSCDSSGCHVLLSSTAQFRLEPKP